MFTQGQAGRLPVTSGADFNNAYLYLEIRKPAL